MLCPIRILFATIIFHCNLTSPGVLWNQFKLLEKFPGEKEVLLSADSVQFDDPGMNELQPYAPEYLNSLVSSSLPLAHLGLKVKCPVMLLRNLDPLKGLCNGTRLRVSQIGRKVLKCRIISGNAKFAGNVMFIPIITLAPSAEDLPSPLSVTTSNDLGNRQQS